MTRNMTVALVALCVVLGCARTAAADTIHVPGDYATIQAAIDAADSGDEIVIADGIWTGPDNKNLDFGGKDITVRSASGDPESCVIDCEEDGRGFCFHGSESHLAVVEGLTLRNGEPADDLLGAPHGGAIYCLYSDPTIVNCVIMANGAIDGDIAEDGGSGGGIYGDHSELTILNCVITANEAGDGGNPSPPLPAGEGGGGGAVFCVDGALFMSGCTVAANSAGDGGGGGGGVCCRNSTVTIVDCVVTSNEAGVGTQCFDTHGSCGGGPGGHGGGINSVDSALTIIDCEISSNAAGRGGSAAANVAYGGDGGHGGGIYAGWNSGELTIVGSSLVGNIAGDGQHGDAGGGGIGGSGGSGGGAFVCSGGTSRFINCVVLDNVAGNIDDQLGFYYGGGNGGGICGDAIEVVNCVLAGNTAGSGTVCCYYGCFSGPGQGGAVYAWNSTITNCTIVYNAPAYDYCLNQPVGCGGVYGSQPGEPAVCSFDGSATTIENCIIWQNGAVQLSGYLDWSGSNNIDTDPLLDGYSLLPDSPCIDAGNNAAVPPDSLDIDGDGNTSEPIPVDVDGNPRFVDDPDIPDSGSGTPPIVDIGAYERQLPGLCASDLTGDGVVDVNDLLLVLGEWGTPDGDVTGDGTTDVNDLLEVIGAWGPCA